MHLHSIRKQKYQENNDAKMGESAFSGKRATFKLSFDQDWLID